MTKDWGLNVVKAALCLTVITVLAACVSVAPVQPTSPADRAVEQAARAESTDTVFLWLNRAIRSFAGIYRDAEGHVRVRLTDIGQGELARPLIEAYLRKTQLGEVTTTSTAVKIDFVPANFTWFDLDAYKAGLRDVLTLPDVIYLDADEVCNCIAIAISTPTARPAVETFVQQAGVPSSAVKIMLRSPIRPLASLNDEFRPVKGGIRIKSDGPLSVFFVGGICTQTATARRAGVPGLITNSHCTRVQGGVEGTNFFQAGSAFGFDFVATETIDPAWTPSLPGCPTGRLCRLSDSAFAEFPVNVGVIGKLARPRSLCQGATPCSVDMDNATDELTIVGLAGAPLVGDARSKIGRTTGWTIANVSVTCASTNVFGTSFTVLCQSIVPAASGLMDSGSPVISLLQGNRAVLAGIVWGGAADGSDFVFSPISAVEAELGSITLVASESPVATPASPCETACQPELDACMADVPSKGGPRPQQCVQLFDACKGACRTGNQP